MGSMYFRRNPGETIFIGRAPQVNRGAAREVLGDLVRDEASMRYLRAVLAQELGASVEQLSDGRVLDELAVRVAQGRLALVGFRPGPAQVPPLKGEEPPPPEEEPPPEDQPDAWLEISLVDNGDPPQPVAGAKYVVELEDGTVIEGYLDDAGKTRIEGIQEGTAKVSFPDFEDGSWDKG